MQIAEDVKKVEMEASIMIFACTFIYILMFCTTCRYEKTSMARECNNKRPHENIYIYILIYIYTHTENFIYNITISIP